MAFAVFFGFVFIGLVFLYTKTRGSWNWKKIALWFGGFVIASILAMVVAIFSDSFKKIVPEKFSTISSNDGITLGDKLSEVEFRKGKLIKGIDSKDANDIIYKVNEQTSIYVDKATQTVSGIVATCADYQSIKFNGIGCGDSGDLIQTKFKGDVTVLCPSTDDWRDKDPVRVFDIPKYGVRYALQKNTVVFMIVFPKSFWAENKTKWVACK
jgi:hypothetical protein